MDHSVKEICFKGYVYLWRFRYVLNGMYMYVCEDLGTMYVDIGLFFFLTTRFIFWQDKILIVYVLNIVVIILQGEHTSQTEEIRRGDVWKRETPGHWNGGYHLWNASRKWLIIFDYLFLSHNKTIWFFNYAVFRLREDNFPFFIKTYRMNWKATKFIHIHV